ncbi:MAG TPA: 2-hydroxymuconate tautomerase [Baekduia sp.]|nr:2-hydroxymuconate tautomerase [Baekduia sp.]
MPLIQVTLVEGRSAEAKRALMEQLTDATVRTIGAPRDAVRVILAEVPPEHWAVGGRPKSDRASDPQTDSDRSTT